MVTPRTVQRLIGVSHPAASATLDELRQAGILDPRKVERNATAYLAREVLDLVAFVERRPVSTTFDTRVAEPVRVVPARR